MGNCKSSLNCNPSDDTTIQADPDIAGLGVVVSFIAAAAITWLAILAGYFSDSLPDSSLSDFDRAFQNRSLRWFRKRLTRGGRRKYTQTTQSEIEGVDGEDGSDAAKERRSMGLERLILTLSDQQLVTGLAILIAGNIGLCNRFYYHYRIIATLAWFSSTTHLSTLTVLRSYMREHPTLRNWRVAGMLALMIMLLFAQFNSRVFALDDSVPSMCIFKAPIWGDAEAFVIIGIIIGFLLLQYAQAIGALYSVDPDWTVFDWVIGSVHKKRMTLSRIQERNILSKREVSSDAKTRWLRYVRYETRLDGYYDTQTGHFKTLARMAFCTDEIQRSLLGRLFTLTFGTMYGMALIITRRSIANAPIVGEQNVMGFGQLVPLLLLVLPLVAAAEVYSDISEPQTEGESLHSHAKDKLSPALSPLKQDMQKTKSGSGVVRSHPESRKPDEQSTSLVRLTGVESDIPLTAMQSNLAHRTTALTDPDSIEQIHGTDSTTELKATVSAPPATTGQASTLPQQHTNAEPGSGSDPHPNPDADSAISLHKDTSLHDVPLHKDTFLHVKEHIAFSSKFRWILVTVLLCGLLSPVGSGVFLVFAGTHTNSKTSIYVTALVIWAIFVFLWFMYILFWFSWTMHLYRKHRS